MIPKLAVSSRASVPSKLAISPLAPAARKLAVSLLLSALLFAAEGCVIVPQNRRGHLADPMMSFSSSRMDAYRNDKLHTTREGAAGGNGQPAGGGCACQ